MNKKQKKKYDEKLTDDSFDIIIKCKRCHSINCFIGIETLGMDHDGVVNIDLVCAHCRYIKNCY